METLGVKATKVEKIIEMAYAEKKPVRVLSAREWTISSILMVKTCVCD